MKKMIIIIILLPFIVLSAKSGVLINNIFNNGDFLQMKSHDKMIGIISHYDLPGYTKTYKQLDCFNGKSWLNLMDGHSTTPNDIDFDKEGNIWVTGDDGLWKYDWSIWRKFILNDSFVTSRTFLKLCIDSSDNIWVESQIHVVDYVSGGNGKGDSITILKDEYTELLKFDGYEFKKIDSSHTLNGFGGDDGLVTTNDGNIIAHFYSGGISSDSIKGDFYFYKNNKKNILPVINPDYFLSKNLSLNCSQIYPDKLGNIWFTFNSVNTSSDPGISILKSDGKWNLLSNSNGLFKRPYGGNPYLDSIYLPTNCVLEDKNDNYWIGGRWYFGYLDKDLKLKIPDSNFFNNCILYGRIGCVYTVNDSSLNDYLYAVTHYNNNTPTINTELKHISYTTDGSIWFEFNNIGILRYNPNGFNDVNSSQTTNSEIKIYPQPISRNDGNFYIDFGGENQLSSVNIFDINGRQILNNEIIFPSRKTQIILPKDISAGCYFVKIHIGTKITCKILLVTN